MKRTDLKVGHLYEAKDGYGTCVIRLDAIEVPLPHTGLHLNRWQAEDNKRAKQRVAGVLMGWNDGAATYREASRGPVSAAYEVRNAVNEPMRKLVLPRNIVREWTDETWAEELAAREARERAKTRRAEDERELLALAPDLKAYLVDDLGLPIDEWRFERTSKGRLELLVRVDADTAKALLKRGKR